MSPEKTMENLLQKFENALNDGKKDIYIPILRNWFAPYILNQHKTIDDAATLFTHEITREDIINAGVIYVDNCPKVSTNRAIHTYLTSVRMFYEAVIVKCYPQSILQAIPRFQGLYPDILNRTTKVLREECPYDCLSDNEYEQLVNYLSEGFDTSYKQKVVKASIELMLLFGFKIDKLKGILQSDFIKERQSLYIKATNAETSFLLDLPFGLFQLLNEISSCNSGNSPYLLLTESQQPITVQYLDDAFKNFKKVTGIKVTTTRLSKAGCVHLILDRVPVEIIGQLTGLGPTQIKDCQIYVSEILKDDINRFLNSKIRGSKTFDDFS